MLAFARTIAADSRFYAPIGDAAISAVEVRDIGAEAASVSPAVAEITGRPATDVMQFAHDYAQAFAA